MLASIRDGAIRKKAELDAQPPKEPTPLERSLEAITTGSEVVRLKKRGKSRDNFQLTSNLRTLCYGSAAGCKPTSEKKVDVQQLREIRSGYTTDMFNKKEKNPEFVTKYPSERCFAVITKSGKVLNLVAEDKKQRDDWVDGLGHLVTKAHEAQRGFKTFRWLWDLFQSADKDGDKRIDLNEAVKLFRELNIMASKDTARMLFDQAGPAEKNGKMVLDVEGFDRFFQLISKRPEVEVLFEKYLSSPDADAWKADDLLKFFQVEQKDSTVTRDECRKMILYHERVAAHRKNEALSLTGTLPP